MHKQALPLPIMETINPQLCINSKLRKLARMTTHIYERNFKEFELRSSQVSILLMIGKMGSTNQKEVADFLFIDYSTMSRDLNKLKDREIIQITKGADARYSLLELTGNGRDLMNRLVPVWNRTNDELTATIGSYSVGNINMITAAMRQHTSR